MNFGWQPGYMSGGDEELLIDGKLVGSYVQFGNGVTVYDDEGYHFTVIARKVSDVGTAKILLLQYFMEKYR